MRMDKRICLKWLVLPLLILSCFSAQAQIVVSQKSASNPYRLEVSDEISVHISFPDIIRYLDLGNVDVSASKAGVAENMLRIKSKKGGFEGPRSLLVITNDGAYYSFEVVYAKIPKVLTLDVSYDQVVPTSESSTPTGPTPPKGKRPDPFTSSSDTPASRSGVDGILFRETGKVTPTQIEGTMEQIYRLGRSYINNKGIREYGMQFGLRGVYIQNGLLYFDIFCRNKTNIPYEVDRVLFKIVDKGRMTNKTLQQEDFLEPLRTHNFRSIIKGKADTRSIYCLKQFSMTKYDELEIQISELGGRRLLKFTVDYETMLRAKSPSELIEQKK